MMNGVNLRRDGYYHDYYRYCNAYDAPASGRSAS
jgi:hypothetical protein